MAYFKDIIKGVRWLGGLKIASRVIAFVKTAILARILAPAQFGLFGITSLVLEFLEILTETGINMVLIQEKKNTTALINTAWIVSIIRGLIICLVILAVSPLIIHFFNSPESYRLLLLMSAVPLIRGFINPAEIKLIKELTFKKEFLFRFSIYIIDTIVAVCMAFITQSAASLIYGLIAGALVEVLLSHYLISPKPKIVFDKAKFKEIIRRGKWITGAGIFDYFFYNLDDIVVGRLLGTGLLGVYQVAYRISTLPITEVSDVFGKVTFPVYVKISEDKNRLTKTFYRTLFSVVLITVPFGIVILLFSKSIILILLGAKWLAAVDVLKILAVFGVIKAISNTVFSLLLSLKKQKYVTFITLFGILGLGITIVPLVNRYGIVGAGLSAFIGTLTAAPVAVYSLNKAFKAIK